MAYVRKLTLTQVRTARDLYWCGWTLQRIADLFGVRWQAIQYALRVRGVVLRDRNARLPKFTVPEAERAGIVVTLRAQDNGDLRSAHVPGHAVGALRFVAAWIDLQDREWRLLSYSTPYTIATDLAGGRIDMSVRAERSTATISGGGRETRTKARPERIALGRIGRLDLLDPSLAL
jgi:hypothetical protein